MLHAGAELIAQQVFVSWLTLCEQLLLDSLDIDAVEERVEIGLVGRVDASQAHAGDEVREQIDGREEGGGADVLLEDGLLDHERILQHLLRLGKLALQQILNDASSRAMASRRGE